MKSRTTFLLLSIGLVSATIPGCGCASHNQVIVQARQGSPIQVETDDGVRVKAPFVDIRVPPSKQIPPGEIDVPAMNPD